MSAVFTNQKDFVLRLLRAHRLFQYSGCNTLAYRAWATGTCRHPACAAERLGLIKTGAVGLLFPLPLNARWPLSLSPFTGLKTQAQACWVVEAYLLFTPPPRGLCTPACGYQAEPLFCVRRVWIQLFSWLPKKAVECVTWNWRNGVSLFENTDWKLIRRWYLVLWHMIRLTPL